MKLCFQKMQDHSAWCCRMDKLTAPNLLKCSTWQQNQPCSELAGVCDEQAEWACLQQPRQNPLEEHTAALNFCACQQLCCSRQGFRDLSVFRCVVGSFEFRALAVSGIPAQRHSVRKPRGPNPESGNLNLCPWVFSSKPNHWSLETPITMQAPIPDG